MENGKCDVEFLPTLLIEVSSGKSTFYVISTTDNLNNPENEKNESNYLIVSNSFKELKSATVRALLHKF